MAYVLVFFIKVINAEKVINANSIRISVNANAYGSYYILLFFSYQTTPTLVLVHSHASLAHGRRGAVALH